MTNNRTASVRFTEGLRCARPLYLGISVLVGLGPSLAHASQQVRELRVPPAGAPAAAYGPDVRPTGHGPNLEDLAGIAERQRENGHLASALHLATRVCRHAPNNTQALQTEISTLSDMNAPDKAFAMSGRPGADLDPATRQRLRASKTAGEIREALRERGRLEDRYDYAHRNDALRQALRHLEANLAVFQKGSPAYRQTQYDRLYTLEQLGRAHAVVAAFKNLKRQYGTLPPYVRRAAADAFLAIREPERAMHLYAALIAARSRPGVDLMISQYYALISAERYEEADQLLARLDKNTPVWRRRHCRRGHPIPNWQRVDVDELNVLDASYNNHPEEAERRARKLYHAAPRNTGIIETLATIRRWRGKPQSAEETTRQAAAYAPREKSTRVNIAANAHALGYYRAWAEHIRQLARLFPNDTSIQKSRAELRDRRRPSISGETQIGSSYGGDTVHGSRDLMMRLRLNSPWTRNGWRAYAEEYYRSARFDSGADSLNRPGVGVEWQWGRKHAWGLLSDDKLTADKAGVRLGWSQWLGDHWQYQLRADTYARETPLRAERAGYRGRLYQGQLTWRQNESRSVTLQAGVLDISDGNLRSMYSGQFSQRIQASAHHLTRATVTGSIDHNSQSRGAYYNPENADSLGFTLEHDWITWRRYDRSLTQHFSAGAAWEWQQGYAATPGFDVQYGHTWDLSRTWSIHYAVGWGSHVYDGNREGRVFGVFGFSGVF